MGLIKSLMNKVVDEYMEMEEEECASSEAIHSYS